MKRIFNLRNGIILLVLGIGLIFLGYRKSILHKIVVERKENWDILYVQNTMASGSLIGKAYQEEYNLDTISSTALTSLVVDYYISKDNTFFKEENRIDNTLYSKTIFEEELNQTIAKMFGPDYHPTLEDLSYGCGRSLKKEGTSYQITSEIPDACKVFSFEEEYYTSFIKKYHKRGKEIIVDIKVGYITSTLDGKEQQIYNVYTNSQKDQLITSNYDPACILEEKQKSSCDKDFVSYKITLKKASDDNYYFYKINKA